MKYENAVIKYRLKKEYYSDLNCFVNMQELCIAAVRG
jgi:hypothetical protein